MTKRPEFLVVPGARVELAWISPNDFESFASTISPAGQQREHYYRGCLMLFKTKLKSEVALS